MQWLTPDATAEAAEAAEDHSVLVVGDSQTTHRQATQTPTILHTCRHPPKLNVVDFVNELDA